MKYTKLILQPSARRKGVQQVRYEGTSIEPGLGKCTNAGLLCEIWKLADGFVVMSPFGEPERIFSEPDDVSRWLATFGAPIETPQTSTRRSGANDKITQPGPVAPLAGRGTSGLCGLSRLPTRFRHRA